ncbi:MFS transporter [Meiothermus hypogaeus]|uniref:Macrolide transporter n=2 Tax=Meiothermus hypogaeus TaxID=884155 RepID=A0A511R0Y1_9DEIN|nr:MFS transporter [Meiothermus hypogaeus]RIH75430.1 H+ Antiporter protein [Meiothermus hypogaeus]GEM83271.1 macrolide transporter [Meiothermus hypogaeus NBRC 106114]
MQPYLSGLRGFTLVAFGQLVSLVGSGMSQFALTIWAFEKTGLATSLALMGFFYMVPLILISPFAGAWVDRGNRKLMMVVSDLGAALGTLAVFLLYLSGSLEIWHLYAVGALNGLTNAFQWPAYSAAISTMVDKKDYARANGLLSLAESASGIGAPILAGIFLGWVGLGGILLLDLVTFAAAFLTLILVHIPQPKQSAVGLESRGSLLSEAIYGFRFIFARPSLLGLQTVFLLGNLVANLGSAIMAAMILARTASSETVLATVQSAAGIGGVLGGVLLSTWGGPRRKVHGVLLGWVLSSFFGSVLLGLGQSVWVWAASAFVFALILPILNGSNQAIWQAKVPPDVQGKVFAARRMIAWVAGPLALLVAGPLADRVLTPAMMPGGSLVGLFGGLVGTGPGAGMALLLVMSGLLGMAVGLGGYFFRAVREAEDLIPDHDQIPGGQGKPLPS